MAVFAVLNRVVGEDLNEKLTGEKRLEGGNGVNHANVGRGREHSRWRHLHLQRLRGIGRTLAFTSSAMGIHKRV